MWVRPQQEVGTYMLSLCAFTPCSSLGSSAKEEAWTWPSDPLASFQHAVDPLSAQPPPW